MSGGRIHSLTDDRPEEPLEELDVSGCAVVPGFVDLQVNGGWGLEFTQQPDGIWQVGARLPRYGVTSFLPTLISPTPDVVTHARAILSDGPPAGYRGATAIGLHLEGPLISEAKRGAHPLERLRLPGQASEDAWRREAWIRLVTVAPELPGMLDVIRRLVQQGIVVSLGHSAASYETAMDGLRAGATAITHLYNAMSPLHHRSPGLVGAGLAHPGLVAGIIVDGTHVHPAAVRVAWRARGPRGIALVTDAASGTGMGEAAHHPVDTNALAPGDAPRTAEGRLSGSLLTMDGAIRNLIAFTGCPLEEAVEAAATAPARLLGEPLGVLRPAAAADVAVLDSKLRVVAALVGGRIVYRADSDADRTGEPGP